MKLTIILLTIGILNVSANGLSQTVSFSGKNIPFREVLSAIKKQTGFAVIYNEVLLDEANRVSLNVTDVPLKDFLRQVFKDQPLDYSIKNTTIVISRKVNSALAVDLKSKDGVLVPPGSVTGRVMNEDGEPLAGASITLKGTNLGAKTDNNGYYKIESVASGEYTLEITYVGYATKTASIKVGESGSAAADIKLAPSLVNLDQITVASTLSSRKIREVPTTMAVLTQADLKNRNLNNIADVLESIPGIVITPGSEISNNGVGRQPTGILIRGTRSNSVSGYGIKYLVDGVEIITYGGSILQTIDPNTIEKIEVLKGPMASTLYGSGAAGGIISITTKKGKSGKTKINFKTMFTDRSNDYADYKGYQQDYSLNVSGGNEQFNYLVGVAYNLYPTTKLTDINNGIDTKTWSYNAKIGGKINNIAADLTLQYGNINYGVGSTTPSLNKYRASLGFSQFTVYPVQDARIYQRAFSTALHLKHTIADNCYQDLTVGYNIMNSGKNDYTPSGGTYPNTEDLYSKINTRYFMFYDHPWSTDVKTSVTAGFEYNGYDVHSLYINGTTPLTNFFSLSTPAEEGSAFFTKSSYSSTGYFAEIVTGFKNKLFLTTGMRYDVNPAYGDNVSGYPQPRVGLSYVMERGKFKIKPRVVWGVSSDAPDPTYKITTITMYPPYETDIIVGNANIKPQRSEGYEFGADIFYGSNYSFNITYYDQKIKDLIRSSVTVDDNTDPITIYYYYYNIASATNRGLEVSGKAMLNSFVIDLNFTESVNKWGKGTTTQGTPLLGIPKRSAFARLTYKVPSFLPWTKKGGSISLDWRYNGSAFSVDDIGYNSARTAWLALPTPRPVPPNSNNYLVWLKGYSYFNLRADYSITNYATVYIDVQNLLDKQGSLNGQSISQFPGRRINFGFNINF